MMRVLSKLPKSGSFTYVFAVAFGIPVGTVISNGFDIDSFLGSLLIMLGFSILGGIIGLTVDQSISAKGKAHSHDD